MEVGYVYIITTKLYEHIDIYKIGCTKNMDQRLKTMNATRVQDLDKFYAVNVIKTFHYFKLECGLHNILKKFRLNNEFFQCPIDTIEDAISQYVNENVFMLHDDKISEEACDRNLKWFPSRNMFSLTQNGTEVYLNEKRLIEELKQWISEFDRCGLYKFLHDNHFCRIIIYLKDNFVQPKTNILNTSDISDDMNSLFISNNDVFVKGGKDTSVKEITDSLGSIIISSGPFNQKPDQ